MRPAEARLLAYGDSLTWGFDPKDGTRHGRAHRWGAVAAGALGWEACEEGLNGRTTARDEWTGPADRNGARMLPAALHSHAPLGAVAIMLGTNDLILCPGTTAVMAGWGVRRLLEIVRTHPYPGGGAAPRASGAPQALLIAPPPLVPGPGPVPDAETIARSRDLAGVYAEVAREMGAAFLDAGAHVRASPVDGVHLDAEATRALGLAVARALGGA